MNEIDKSQTSWSIVASESELKKSYDDLKVKPEPEATPEPEKPEPEVVPESKTDDKVEDKGKTPEAKEKPPVDDKAQPKGKTEDQPLSEVERLRKESEDNRRYSREKSREAAELKKRLEAQDEKLARIERALQKKNLDLSTLDEATFEKAIKDEVKPYEDKLKEKNDEILSTRVRSHTNVKKAELGKEWAELLPYMQNIYYANNGNGDARINWTDVAEHPEEMVEEVIELARADRSATQEKTKVQPKAFTEEEIEAIKVKEREAAKAEAKAEFEKERAASGAFSVTSKGTSGKTAYKSVDEMSASEYKEWVDSQQEGND